MSNERGLPPVPGPPGAWAPPTSGALPVPPPGAPTPYGAPPTGADTAKQKKRWILPTAVGVAALLIGVAIGGLGGSEDAPAAADIKGSEEYKELASDLESMTKERDLALEQTADQESDIKALEDAVAEKEAALAEKEAAEDAAIETPADPAPEAESSNDADLTPGQRNAIGSAEDYLAYSGFSRSGLIGQLEYEGYSTDEATFAVDHVAPDWNEQAARLAHDYLDYSSFSRQGLIDQLIYEGFTAAEAEAGVSAVGY